MRIFCAAALVVPVVVWNINHCKKGTTWGRSTAEPSPGTCTCYKCQVGSELWPDQPRNKLSATYTYRIPGTSSNLNGDSLRGGIRTRGEYAVKGKRQSTVPLRCHVSFSSWNTSLLVPSMIRTSAVVVQTTSGYEVSRSHPLPHQ